MGFSIGRRKGFSLIELMVVVAILSVAAAIAVPRFIRHQLALKQQECHRNLRSLAVSEKNYFDRHGRYSADLDALGWKPEGKGLYQYRFRETTADDFLFECEGNLDRDAAVDRSSIDQTGTLRQEVDDGRS